MKTYEAKIKSVSPLSQSRYHGTEKASDRESADDYEKRTWPNKLTTNPNGDVVIRGSALKFALDRAAKDLKEPVKGKGKQTYMPIFKAGVLIVEDLNIGIKGEFVAGIWRESGKGLRVEANWVHVNADGVRGSGKRVMRCFPTIREWAFTAIINVLDEAITRDVLERHIIRAGGFVGLGQYRPENGGTNGRFVLESMREI